MNKRNHRERMDARKELTANGFITAFSTPGRPELWAKPKDKRRFAVQREQRERSERWHIIPYPEPSVCSPEEVSELLERDGILLNGDQGIQEFSWLN